MRYKVKVISKMKKIIGSRSKQHNNPNILYYIIFIKIII